MSSHLTSFPKSPIQLSPRARAWPRASIAVIPRTCRLKRASSKAGLGRHPAGVKGPLSLLVVEVVERQLGHVLVRLLGVEATALLAVIEDATKAVLERPADVASGTVDWEVALQRVDNRRQVVLISQDEGDDRLLVHDLQGGVCVALAGIGGPYGPGFRVRGAELAGQVALGPELLEALLPLGLLGGVFGLQGTDAARDAAPEALVVGRVELFVRELARVHLVKGINDGGLRPRIAIPDSLAHLVNDAGEVAPVLTLEILHDADRALQALLDHLRLAQLAEGCRVPAAP